MKTYRSGLLLLLLVLLMQLVLSACGKEITDIPIQTAEPTETEHPEEPANVNPRIILGSAEAHPGDEVVVPVEVAESPGIAAFRLVVEYDEDSLTLLDVSYGPAFIKNGEEPARLTSPFMLAWSQLENLEGDAVLAELTFKVSDKAKVFRSFPVTITCTPADLINIDEEEVPFAIENGSISTVRTEQEESK